MDRILHHEMESILEANGQSWSTCQRSRSPVSCRKSTPSVAQTGPGSSLGSDDTGIFFGQVERRSTTRPFGLFGQNHPLDLHFERPRLHEFAWRPSESSLCKSSDICVCVDTSDESQLIASWVSRFEVSSPLQSVRTTPERRIWCVREGEYGVAIECKEADATSTRCHLEPRVSYA